MASTASTSTNKRKRVEENGTSHSSSAQQEVLDCLLSKLSLNDSTTSNRSFQQEITQLHQDQQLLQALQDSLKELENRVQKKQVECHQEYSIFNTRLDKGVRDLIVSFLDEEGLWVLEESTMIQHLEDNQEQWKDLYEKRNHVFPEVEEDSDEEEGDTPDRSQRFRLFKEYGIYFAKASRMARCLEEMAQTHYGTDFPIPTKQSRARQLNQEWPTQRNRTLREDRMNNIFFVRIAYRHDDDLSPMVLEGFVDLPHATIRREPGHSEVIMEFSDVDEAVCERLYSSLSQVYEEEEFVDHNRIQQVKRQMGNRLCITVLELILTNEVQYNFVLSTTGYSREDGEYLYLAPRSPDPKVTTAGDGDECLRVGLDFEIYGGNLQIQLTG